ncbi:MAG: DNA internalization-related competence protein ComEC/Rec2 [Rhodoferax sp.]|nr:DNA internalization-related competence protein ComEC/Rec2 [Rhodoferax sp.]
MTPTDSPAIARSAGLFWLLLAWVLGTAIQLQQARLWSAWVYMAFGLLALAGYAVGAHKRIANRAWMTVSAVLAIGLLAFACTGGRALWFLDSALDPTLEGRDVLVQGVVRGLPQRNESGLRFRLDVETAELDGSPLMLPPRIDAAWYGDPGSLPPAAIQAGERWRMTLRLKAPHGARNPNGFDYELWLWEQGVQATGYVRPSARDVPPQRLAQTALHPVDWARQQLRDRIVATVQPRQTAGLIAALVVGDQNAIDRVDWDVFRATGVAHLVSISGLHITMFAWGAAFAVGWLWRRSGRLCLRLPAPSAALVGGFLLATAYAVFSGWGVPAQRTCLMLATVTLLRLSGLRWPWPLVWMLACAVVVAVDPWALLQPGFWLSFVAVGVLFATDSGAARAHSAGVKGRVVSMFREQWVVTVALAPLTLLLFGQVSLVGLIANAIAIPWVTLVITPLSMLGALMPGLWDVAGWAIALWMQLLQLLQWLAALPWATVSLATPPLLVAVAGVAGGLLLVLPGPWHLRALGLPLVLPVLLWQAPLPPDGQFELLAADVGQGNAVLVRTANHALLYDTGPRYSQDSDAGHRVLLPLLQALHTRLDRVVLSHRDIDHAGGAAAVLGMQPQADFFSSVEADHPLQALRPITRCEAGQRWVWDGVNFEILHPQPNDYATQAKPNALSCVLRISAGAQTALLVGDIEQLQETWLVENHTDLKAQVLLVPHHGSKTSSSNEFLDAVQPQWALVQSGYRNRFGHPASPVVQRYQERKITVLDSPHCGAMTWQSWQADRVDCHRSKALRYWHHHVP